MATSQKYLKIKISKCSNLSFQRLTIKYHHTLHNSHSKIEKAFVLCITEASAKTVRKTTSKVAMEVIWNRKEKRKI